LQLHDLQDEANKKRAERFGIPLVTKLEGKDGKQKQFRKFKKWGVGKPVGKKFRRNGGRQGDGLKSGNGGTQKNRTNKFKEGQRKKNSRISTRSRTLRVDSS